MSLPLSLVLIYTYFKRSSPVLERDDFYPPRHLERNTWTLTLIDRKMNNILRFNKRNERRRVHKFLLATIV